jgi:hypothetical protein
MHNILLLHNASLHHYKYISTTTITPFTLFTINANLGERGGLHEIAFTRHPTHSALFTLFLAHDDINCAYSFLASSLFLTVHQGATGVTTSVYALGGVDTSDLMSGRYLRSLSCLVCILWGVFNWVGMGIYCSLFRCSCAAYILYHYIHICFISILS